ncbi:uncharacterized protein [Coffea arabica]|uniref:High mobility group B protein 6-like n=1 Tax=Coffea arabica TaxID=13443 RepID=A0A6P6SLB9_COFAR|nr:uncharacterized protein LOC113692502 [Coffea arabica]
MLKAAQSPLSDHQIQRPKSGRKPLQPKNSPATPVVITPHQKPKQNAATDRIEVSVLDNDSNKENVNPLFATPVKNEEFRIEQFDSSLAEELSAIREKLERLRIEKEKTEKMLSERDLVLDLQMNELHKRGEAQKMLEIEVDRLYRLKQLKLSCMGISPIRSLRNKAKEKGEGTKTDYRDEVNQEESL